MSRHDFLCISPAWGSLLLNLQIVFHQIWGTFRHYYWSYFFLLPSLLRLMYTYVRPFAVVSQIKGFIYFFSLYLEWFLFWLQIYSLLCHLHFLLSASSDFLISDIGLLGLLCFVGVLLFLPVLDFPFDSFSVCFSAELPYVFIYFSHFPLFHWMPL